MKRKIRKTSTGFKGIYKHKATGKYEVNVIVSDNSKTTRFYVGLRATIPEAVEARNEFIKNLL